jgi:hypothetical protein
VLADQYDTVALLVNINIKTQEKSAWIQQQILWFLMTGSGNFMHY